MPYDLGSVISIQPEPTITFVSRLNGVTAIGRRWDPGDTRRCRLCPQCTADHEAGGCLITTEDPVGTEDAPLYSFTDWGGSRGSSREGDLRRTTPTVPSLFLPGAGG